MRKIIVLLMLLLMASVSYGTLTYDGTYYLKNWSTQFSSGTHNAIYLALEEIESDLDSIVAGTGIDLDDAYTAGQGITIDSGAVTLTTTTDSDSAALAIVHGETGNYSGMTLTNASAYPGIQITTSGAGADITGTSATWTISKAGALTCVGVTSTGEITQASDVLFNSTYDVAWDENRNQFIWQDNAVLGLGGAHDAAADVTLKWNGTNLLIEAATEDTGQILLGSTNSMDLVIYNDSAAATITANISAELLALNGWDIQVQDGDYIDFGDSNDFTMTATNTAFTFGSATSDESSVYSFGADQDGDDVKFFGATSGAYAMWDASANQVLVAGGGQITLNDSVELLIGTGASNAGDFSITGNGTGPLLQIDVVSAGSGEIEIGNDADDVPMKWYSETAGDYVYFSGDDLIVEDVSLVITEGTQIQFGDPAGTGDVTLSCASNVLTIGQVVAGTGSLALGADNKGVDTTFYAETAGDYVMWDQDGASNLGALIFEDSVLQFAGANVTYSTAISTDALAITATDHANASITIGAAGTTNSIDLTLYGFTAGNTVVFNGGAETLTLTDVDLNIAVPDATDVGTTITAGGANTASLAIIDGATGGAAWIGAATTGMLHLTSDGALVADGSLLRIASSGNISAANDGACLEIVESGAAQATSYAMRIASTNNEALHVDTGEVLVDEVLTATKGLQVGVGETLEATNAEGAGQTIDAGVTVANVTSVANGATDFITLPNEPSIGTVVKVLCNAGSNFEIRTLEAGNDKINNVDTSDGGTEYLATDTDMIIFTCVSADNWQAVSYPLAGGVRAAVTPD